MDCEDWKPCPGLGSRCMVKCAAITIGLSLVVSLATLSAEPKGGQPIKARLSLEMQTGAGRLQLEADAFQAVVLPSAVESGTQSLVPTRFRVTMSGHQETTYSVSGGSNAPDDWLSQHEIRVNLDDQVDGVLDSAGPLDWPEIVRTAPVRVSIGQGELPLVEVSASSTAPGPGSAWKLTRRNGSIRTEGSRTRFLQDGQMVEGGLNAQNRAVEPRFQIAIGAGREERDLRHGRLQGPEFLFEDEDLRAASAATGRRLLAGGEITGTSRSDSLPGVQGGFGAAPILIKWQFSMGEPPDVGWFEAVASEKPAWLPSWGGHRDFMLKFSRPEMIEEVEVLLEGVSRLPGVALNAGEAVAARLSGWQDQRRPFPVEFRDGDFVLKWNRTQVVASDRPEDSGPDLYFAVTDHPGFTAEEAGARPGRIATKSVKSEIPLRVRSADWAASGRLGVRVKVEGIWESLPAKGPGLAPDTFVIGLPSDSDGNGLPDGFEGAGNGDSDVDGDGVKLSQEYRGIVAGGKHRRLSPDRREVFLFDPQGCLGEEERIALSRRFVPWKMELIFLDEGETRIGEIPVIAVESLQMNFLPQILRIEDAATQKKAFRAIRPRPGCFSLFVGGKIEPQLLAGDLARILDLNEFGSQP